MTDKHKVPDERFWSKVDKRGPGECWIWKASLNAGGYGQFWHNDKMRRAHRFAYEACVSPIPAELGLDHLCRNRACVNPAHLEPVTARENVLRGNGFAAANVSKTHCPSGHEYNATNTYISKQGTRVCRACRVVHRRAWKARTWTRK